MSESRCDRPAGAVLYSEKLLGLRSECPACGEWERSTGWLLSREGDSPRWYVDLKCTGCLSNGGTWKREWLPLIEEVLTAECGPLMAAPSTRVPAEPAGAAIGNTDPLATAASDKPRLPERSDFPAGTEFVIKEFDVPLVRVPSQGWFNWFGGTPHPYDERSLRVDNNWPAGSFEEWRGVVETSRRAKQDDTEPM